MDQILYKIRIRKGDTVIIRAGKYKGKTGKVLAVHPKTNKVTVEGINIVKRHRKPSRTHPQGGVSEITKPLWVSKVGIYDSQNKKASRIGYKSDDKGTKNRFMKTTNKELK
jgi:large subunit ribosomal protein L24